MVLPNHCPTGVRLVASYFKWRHFESSLTVTSVMYSPSNHRSSILSLQFSTNTAIASSEIHCMPSKFNERRWRQSVARNFSPRSVRWEQWQTLSRCRGNFDKTSKHSSVTEHASNVMSPNWGQNVANFRNRFTRSPGQTLQIRTNSSQSTTSYKC